MKELLLEALALIKKTSLDPAVTLRVREECRQKHIKLWEALVRIEMLDSTDPAAKEATEKVATKKVATKKTDTISSMDVVDNKPTLDDLNKENE